MISADFHLHTCFSPDCKTSLDEIVEAVLRARLDCIAITDHDTIEGALQLKESASFQVIVGEEISSAGGHIIGLFLEKTIPAGLSVQDTIACIHEQGGFAIAPHPFASLATESLQDNFLAQFHLFDAIEVRNSNNFAIWDDYKAERFAKENNLLAVCGSDSHCARGIGSSRVILESFTDSESLRQALTSARIESKVHSPLYFLEHAKNTASICLQERWSKGWLAKNNSKECKMVCK